MSQSPDGSVMATGFAKRSMCVIPKPSLCARFGPERKRFHRPLQPLQFPLCLVPLQPTTGSGRRQHQRNCDERGGNGHARMITDSAGACGLLRRLFQFRQSRAFRVANKRVVI